MWVAAERHLPPPPGAALQATEDALGFWMDQMHGVLTYENAALVEADPEKESVLDASKGAVCQVSACA